MGGERHVEVEYQSGKFIPLSNNKIDAMNKDNFYARILQREIKEKKSGIKKSL